MFIWRFPRERFARTLNMSGRTACVWKPQPVTHWWWAWCSPRISLRTGCWSIRGSTGSFPWRWSADPTAASCSRCIGSTRGATACLGRSPRPLWWPRRKQRRRESELEHGVTFWASMHCGTLHPRLGVHTYRTPAVAVPSYKRSTGRQIASRSRPRRRSQRLLGWRTCFLLAAGSGGTGSRSHASCSPCIPFCGNLAQGIRAA